MKLLAIVQDGFREARDKRISIILAILSLLVAGMCASMRFEPPTELTGAALRAIGRFNSSTESPSNDLVIVRSGTADSLETIARRLERQGFAVERKGDALHARAAEPSALPGAKMYMLFDAAGPIELPISAREFIVAFELVLGAAIAGWVGVIIAIIVTAGFVPSMLAPGAIHVLLAKPVRRPAFVVGKYAGGIAFVLAHAALLIGLSWAALSWRLGWWETRFLLLIPCVAGVFATIYAISVLCGVLFESPMVATLLSLGFWGACSVVGQVRVLLRAEEFDLPQWAKDGIEGLYWTLPKPGELSEMVQRMIQPHMLEDVPEKLAAVLVAREYAWSLGTTAAFTAGVIALACLVFWRKDY